MSAGDTENGRVDADPPLAKQPSKMSGSVSSNQTTSPVASDEAATCIRTARGALGQELMAEAAQPCKAWSGVAHE